MKMGRDNRCVGCGRRLPGHPVIIRTEDGETFRYCTYECFVDSFDEKEDNSDDRTLGKP